MNAPYLQSPNNGTDLSDSDSISIPPPSPCNKICVLDSTGSVCTGCYRTLDEIAQWSELSVAEKYKVLALITERRTKSGDI